MIRASSPHPLPFRCYAREGGGDMRMLYYMLLSVQRGAEYHKSLYISKIILFGRSSMREIQLYGIDKSGVPYKSNSSKMILLGEKFSTGDSVLWD